ncbi:MAG: hypothetical protein ACJA2G_000856 [Cognaticolwellia sp.]|jgi:hypothetical protein
MLIVSLYKVATANGRWPALVTRVKNNQERCLNKTKQANNRCQNEIVALSAYVQSMENPQQKKQTQDASS